MNILWLASWYPNRVSPYNGDFIERHAKAVAPFVEQLTVICAVKDEAMAPGSSEIIRSQEGNIITYRIYYGSSQWGRIGEKLFSYRQFMQLHRKAFERSCAESGMPRLVHVHIAMKAGLFALELKKKYQLPFIVTEQWTGYFPEAKPNIYEGSFLFRKLTRRVLQASALVLPVSDYLGRIINQHVTQVPYKVVPNVVDTNLFHPVEHKENTLLELVHISVMGYQKNVEHMIEALALLKANNIPFRMQLFGPPQDALIRLVAEKKLGNEVIFMGELPQYQLATYLQQADALVLYSRYETFGCVLIEANAAGLPVVVSDFPVFHEFIQEGLNGIFVEGASPAALAGKLSWLASHKASFNAAAIAGTTNNAFSYSTVGKSLQRIYSELIKTPPAI